MVTTPIAHHSVSLSRALSSMMPFPVTSRPAHVDPAKAVDAYVAMPAAATAQDTTVVVNPWLGGGTCGGAGNDLSSTTTFFGIATKRITPGRFEGMT